LPQRVPKLAKVFASFSKKKRFFLPCLNQENITMDPFSPAWRLAELTRSGQISCVELLENYLQRVQRFNAPLNAIVLKDLDRARARARSLDAQGRAGAGPLFGVPMTVKESFDYAGHATTWGFPFRQTHRALQDALAVTRLEDAGAVVFGKTNVPVGLADWQSFNPIYGSTNNPWNLGYSPGGSSGGGAAACAAGLVGLELGSDIGGSIRVPAHFCGLFGHKSTWGLCSGRGHSLFEAGAPPDISVIGPMARSARDLELALHVIQGADPAETAMRVVLPPPRATQPRGLRVAVWAHEPGQPTDLDIVASVQAAGRYLEGAGARVDFNARPDFDPVLAYHLYLTLLDAALSGRMTDDMLAQRRAARDAIPEGASSADAVMLRATDMSHRAWLQSNDLRFRLRRAWSRFFQDWDVLLCPVISTPAFPHNQLGESWQRQLEVNGVAMPFNDQLFWPGITCGYHLPATVAPVGVSSGKLPIGVQIVGPLYGDLTTIAVAGMLETGYRPFTPPPGWN
jgi:amidase